MNRKQDTGFTEQVKTNIKSKSPFSQLKYYAEIFILMM
jgi:hypothetical protein